MKKIFNILVILQALLAGGTIAVERFYDYVIVNEISSFFVFLFAIAKLVTLVLSLILSGFYLWANKNSKSAIIALVINALTIIMLFLPVEEWGIKYNFEKYLPEREQIVEQILNDDLVAEGAMISVGDSDDVFRIAVNEEVELIEKDGRVAVFFCMYEGILGDSEGFLFLTNQDTKERNVTYPQRITELDEMGAEWQYCVVYYE